ncbi:MAG: hypothetical protein ABI806_19125 [Candidatus Solibacter sp.]
MIEQRRHLRYRVEASQLAKAHFEGIPGKRDHRPVLIANLSYSGCNLIAIGQPEELIPGDDMLLEFDPEDAVELEIVRVERLTQHAIQIGCRFLD